MEPSSRSNARLCIRRWGGSACIALAMGVAALAASCSPEKHYKVLSFFFDGVPDPNAPKVSPDEEFATNAQGQQVRVYTHKPFKDNQCGACHTAAAGKFEEFNKVDQSVCLKCHQKETTKFAVMHGPVAAGQCLACHNPHESTIPGMLNEKAPAVCTQCHESTLLPQDDDHLKEESRCLGCHVGHGGERHGLLRASAATTAPTSQPAPAPGGAPR